MTSTESRSGRLEGGAPVLTPTAPAEGDWTVVDEGWGRKAVDFAVLSEPGNCREYVALHHPLASQRATALSTSRAAPDWPSSWRVSRASCAGIDASPRLVESRDRNPDADIQVGDMHAMPWADESFDVATSFRGIWGTTPRRSARSIVSSHRAADSGSPCGDTSRCPRVPGRSRPSGWRRPRRSSTRRRWSPWADRASAKLCWPIGFVDIRRSTSVRMGILGPRDVRASPGLDRPRLRGDPERRRTGVH